MRRATRVGGVLLAAAGVVGGWLLLRGERATEEATREDRGREVPAAVGEPTLLAGRRPGAAATEPVAPSAVLDTPTGGTTAGSGDLFSPEVRYELYDAETGLSIPTPPDVATEVEVAQDQGPWYDGLYLFTPIPGYVLWDGLSWQTEIAPGIRGARAVVPLRREMDVTVRLDLPAEGPAADELLVFWSLGSFQSVPRDFGRPTREVRLEGVPFLHGERLKVFAALRQGTFSEGVTGPYGKGEALLPEDARTRVVVTVPVPPLPGAGATTESVLEAEVADHFENDNDLPTQVPTDRGHGDVLVRARTRDGAPVRAGVLLHLGTWGARTDAEGTARFEGVYAGERLLTMQAVGVVPVSRMVNVVADTTTTIDLVEPLGASLDVSVVDGDERPLPAARIFLNQASGVAWTEVEDGVQRIDPFTDFRGRRLFRRVEPGRVVVLASYGSRDTSVALEVADGQTKVVQIVLR